MTETAPAKKFRFKVANGSHVTGRGENKVIHKRGDIIETDQDLSKHNKLGPPRFVRVYEDGSTDEGSQVVVTRSSPMDQQPGESDAAYSARLLEVAAAKADTAKAKEEDDLKLEKMTVAQLRQFAADEEIDLEGETTKDAILKILRTARG